MSAQSAVYKKANLKAWKLTGFINNPVLKITYIFLNLTLLENKACFENKSVVTLPLERFKVKKCCLLLSMHDIEHSFIWTNFV